MVEITMELLINGRVIHITIEGENAKEVAVALQDALEQLNTIRW